jgi:hypothetical protein
MTPHVPAVSVLARVLQHLLELPIVHVAAEHLRLALHGRHPTQTLRQAASPKHTRESAHVTDPHPALLSPGPHLLGMVHGGLDRARGGVIVHLDLAALIELHAALLVLALSPPRPQDQHNQCPTTTITRPPNVNHVPDTPTRSPWGRPRAWADRRRTSRRRRRKRRCVRISGSHS